MNVDTSFSSKHDHISDIVALPDLKPEGLWEKIWVELQSDLGEQRVREKVHEEANLMGTLLN